MDYKKKKIIFSLLVVVALIILIGVGATFAYFSASVNSAEDAVNLTSAEFAIELKDDTTLIKSNVIPTEERFVDIAINRRNAETGEFLKPYEVENDDGSKELVTKDTVCIDDNLNEICSVYTFTVINPMTDTDVPLYITLKPSMNTFENLYFKVVDSNLNEVISATRILDSRYEIDSETGGYAKDELGNWIKKDKFDELTVESIVLEGINNKLERTTDEENPSSVTYSIVIWIMETGEVQNDFDGGKIFASTLYVTAAGEDGKGITGYIAAAGTEGKNES